MEHISALKDTFPCGFSRAEIAKQLFSRKQADGESPTLFTLETIHLCKLWDPPVNGNSIIELLFEQLSPNKQDYIELHKFTISKNF